MATYTPEACFRFAAEQITLLRDICYRPEGLADRELRQLILRFRKPDQPASDFIFRQLREMEMVEEMPGQTAFFELAGALNSLCCDRIADSGFVVACLKRALPYFNEMHGSHAESTRTRKNQ